MNNDTRKRGKKITMFLMDGDPSGLISVDLSNWSGKSYKIPRSRINDCKDIDDLSSETSTGIYFLFGKSDNDKDAVYLGETEGILTRLRQHLKNKDFWNEAIVFIGKDLNKAHVKYMESRFWSLATDAGRYDVINKNNPSQSSLSAADEAEMEEFIENARLLVPTLGHKTFEGKRAISDSPEKTLFFIKGARGADARGEIVPDGFVVLNGSKAASSTVPSTPEWVTGFRDKLHKSGIVRSVGDEMVFSEDYIFPSPSAAAAVVMGRSANGLIEWKLPDGRTLKGFESGSDS